VIMDAVTAIRVGSIVVMFLIFIGIVWWAYGGRSSPRFHVAAHSLLHDDDAPRATGDGRQA